MGVLLFVAGLVGLISSLFLPSIIEGSLDSAMTPLQVEAAEGLRVSASDLDKIADDVNQSNEPLQEFRTILLTDLPEGVSTSQKIITDLDVSLERTQTLIDEDVPPILNTGSNIFSDAQAVIAEARTVTASHSDYAAEMSSMSADARLVINEWQDRVDRSEGQRLFTSDDLYTIASEVKYLEAQNDWPEGVSGSQVVRDLADLAREEGYDIVFSESVIVTTDDLRGLADDLDRQLSGSTAPYLEDLPGLLHDFADWSDQEGFSEINFSMLLILQDILDGVDASDTLFVADLGENVNTIDTALDSGDEFITIGGDFLEVVDTQRVEIIQDLTIQRENLQSVNTQLDQTSADLVVSGTKTFDLLEQTTADSEQAIRNISETSSAYADTIESYRLWPEISTLVWLVVVMVAVFCVAMGVAGAYLLVGAFEQTEGERLGQVA